AADRQAVGAYVAAAVVSLLAEGLFEESDGNAAVATLAEACDEPLEAARFELHRTASSSPLLIELPPLVACEIQLRLLQRLGVASEGSVWRTEEGSAARLLSIGDGAESRRVRASAKAVLCRGSSLPLFGVRNLRSAVVR